MSFFEQHAHYNDEKFNEDREEVIQKVYNSGVTGIVNAGYSVESSMQAIKLAEKYSFIYATCGVSPNDIPESKEEIDTQLKEIKKFAKSRKKVIAIGEIGLDYHYNPSEENKELQKRIFIGQIKIAEKYNLPIVIHSRDADFDTFDIVTKLKVKVPVDLHCYSGSYELAMRYIANGIDIHFGIGGVVTFKNAKRLVEVVEKVPTERLLLETDAPYLAPTPYRGQRNEPSYLKEVIKKFSQIKNIEENELSEMLINNTKRVFKI